MNLETIISGFVSLLVGGGVMYQLGGIKATLEHVLDHVEDHDDRITVLEKEKGTCSPQS